MSFFSQATALQTQLLISLKFWQFLSVTEEQLGPVVKNLALKQ